MSAGCKATQNKLGAGGAWCVGHDNDVVALFVLFFFGFPLNVYACDCEKMRTDALVRVLIRRERNSATTSSLNNEDEKGSR